MNSRLFWSHVQVSDSGCWLWTASRNPKGYGQFNVDGKCRLAHRLAYMDKVGQIPAGMCVLHQCDTPGCVKPSHLFIGTKADNNADMDAKGRARRDGFAKLTRDQARAIRAAEGKHQDIANAFGVHQTTVTRVKNGQVWRHA